MIFSSKSDFSRKNRLKIWFVENVFPQIIIIRKVWFSKSAGKKILNSKSNWLKIFRIKISFCSRNFASESDSFFSKLSFETLFFNEKVCFKTMPFKISTKNKKISLLRTVQIESKRRFSDVIFSSKSDFPIKIELKTWFFDKKFFPKYDYAKSLVFEICRDQKFSIRNLTLWKMSFQILTVWEKVCFRIWFLFPKNSFECLIFNEKGCYKTMPFKTSTKTEKNCYFLRSKFSRTDFTQMWTFHHNLISQKNWTLTVLFRKQFFSKIWLFEKFCFRNLPERKSLRLKSDMLKKFHFKGSFSGKKFASEADSFLSKKTSFQTLIFNENVCFEIMPFKLSRKNEKFSYFYGANWVKITFFRCDCFVEILFFNKNWAQNLIFRK